MIKKVRKNTVSLTYIIEDVNCEEIFGAFYAKELRKANQIEFKSGKVMEKKGDKLYVK